MRTTHKTTLLASLLGAALMLPVAAEAETAFTATDTSLHAGPGRDYPRLDELPPDARLFVYGCVDHFLWCDVAMGPERGWVDGDRLVMDYEGHRAPIIEIGPRLRLPVLAFNFDGYWDEHYRNRDFYRDRDRWREHRFAERREEHREHEEHRPD